MRICKGGIERNRRVERRQCRAQILLVLDAFPGATAQIRIKCLGLGAARVRTFPRPDQSDFKRAGNRQGDFRLKRYTSLNSRSKFSDQI